MIKLRRDQPERPYPNQQIRILESPIRTLGNSRNMPFHSNSEHSLNQIASNFITKQHHYPNSDRLHRSPLKIRLTKQRLDPISRIVSRIEPGVEDQEFCYSHQQALNESFQEHLEKPLYNTRVSFADLESTQYTEPAVNNASPEAGRPSFSPSLPSIALDHEQMAADLHLAHLNHQMLAKAQRMVTQKPKHLTTSVTASKEAISSTLRVLSRIRTGRRE